MAAERGFASRQAWYRALTMRELVEQEQEWLLRNGLVQSEEEKRDALRKICDILGARNG